VINTHPTHGINRHCVLPRANRIATVSPVADGRADLQGKSQPTWPIDRLAGQSNCKKLATAGFNHLVTETKPGLKLQSNSDLFGRN
jgi:hypothetical protein